MLVAGCGFLGLLLRLGLSALPVDAVAAQPVLLALQARLDADGPAASPAQVQRRLDEALAAAPRLQAIDLVGPDGRVHASTEPTAVGRPADEGLDRPGFALAAANTGRLVAHPLAAAGPPTPLPGLALLAAPAVVLPLLLLVMAVRQRFWPAAADPAADAQHTQAQQRLLQARQRLARAAQEVEWLQVSDDTQQTGVFTRTGVGAPGAP